MAGFSLVLLQWSTKIRYWINDWLRGDDPECLVWHRKPLSVFALYLFCFLLAYWEVNIPSTGKAVAALAVAAAAMTIRGEMHGKEKLAWMLLLFAFLSLEITSIDKEQQSTEQLRITERQQEKRAEAVEADHARQQLAQLLNLHEDVAGIKKEIEVARANGQFDRVGPLQERQAAKERQIAAITGTPIPSQLPSSAQVQPKQPPTRSTPMAEPIITSVRTDGRHVQITGKGFGDVSGDVYIHPHSTDSDNLLSNFTSSDYRAIQKALIQEWGDTSIQFDMDDLPMILMADIKEMASRRGVPPPSESDITYCFQIDKPGWGERTRCVYPQR